MDIDSNFLATSLIKLHNQWITTIKYLFSRQTANKDFKHF